MCKSVDNVNHMDSNAAADAVLDLVHTVMHQFRSLQYQALRGGPHDITHMESKVMGFFSAHPGATLSDLAQHSGRDKAQLARLVKGLRDRELLVGEPDPADRRNIRLALSPAGHSVQQALRRKARSLNGRAVEGLTAEQQQVLVALLSQVKANLGELE